ncbi:LysR substrate-binding domain-containing protein [Yoonia sediminilitoris]|uniref:LysR family glycine cleavage system transcriptional activator n=1 Tax=Yoonia sediminilitoris TaxID=1286148 RepID=A0A2T6K603_9RHOB|nr:LysR substrate-binding domain-containing protein [Yoonia sediminilitoris]PUB10068.1 LysR family glycine cleavage system transcriptional activator [Yoonia sediminilitoris]RCW89664.1 LysR family glycine cleavage system transcriptional activator [Yoonia sediminilitoris]
MSFDWRNLPSLTALRAFEATAREGSFANAARALNVTHAAVAQQVRALERDLGVSLATRQGRRVVLTSAGQRLAIALTNAFSSISDEIAQTRAGAASRGLRVTCSPFMAERVIMPNLKDFWLHHSGAEISLSPTRAYVDLVAEGFDIGIRSRHPAVQDGSISSGLESFHLKRIQAIGIAAPALVNEHINAPEDLPWLWHDDMDLELKLMRSGGLDVDRLKQARIGSPNLLLEAVRGGIGATIFTESLAQDEIDAGRVVRVDIPRPIEVDYVAVIPKGPPHPLALPFADWVRTFL